MVGRWELGVGSSATNQSSRVAVCALCGNRDPIGAAATRYLGAIAHLGNRDKITRQVPAKQLTHICTAPKAVVARAALGRARDAHTIPNLDPPHLGSDRLHHANAAMSLHEGHVIHVRTGEAD